MNSAHFREFRIFSELFTRPIDGVATIVIMTAQPRNDETRKLAMISVKQVTDIANQSNLNFAADRRYVVIARKDDQNRQHIVDTKYDTESSVRDIVSRLAR